MASATIKLVYDKPAGNLRMPVTITNPKNKKSVVAQLLPDTGATNSVLDNSFARTLGIDVKSGVPQVINGQSGNFYRHQLLMKVGNLKPVNAPVDINTAAANFKVNILGAKTMLLFERVTFQGMSITFTEKGTTPVQKQAAYAYTLPAWYSFRKRI